MRTTRLYTPQALTTGATVIVGGKAAHHVIHVLRLQPGAALRVFDGKGNEHEALLVHAGRSDITLEIGAACMALPEPALRLRLAQGIARHDRMDLILQKSVELGIGELQPLWMQRSQSHLDGKRLEKRIQHWHGIIAGACEQCGRATLPSLNIPQPCTGWLESHADDGPRLMLEPDAENTLAGLPAPTGTVTLLIGPEGGMNDAEKALAASKGFLGVRLGKRILRTETAALAALAGIQALWGDYR